MDLLPFTTQDVQMLQLLKPHLSLVGRNLVDGLLAVACVTSAKLQQDLSPLPVLQFLNFFRTRAELKAEYRSRVLAAGSAEEGRLVAKLPLDSKDVSLMLAIKPFLSDKSQTLIDTLVNLLAVVNSPPEKKVDPEALANLINLIAQANEGTAAEKTKTTVQPTTPPPFPVYTPPSLQEPENPGL